MPRAATAARRASRSSNVHLAAGSVTPAALMADIADGVYVTELIGMGVNGVTGDYSRGASGCRIVDGELAGPVAEFTVAGNLIDMFARADRGRRSRMAPGDQRADLAGRRDDRGGGLSYSNPAFFALS